MSAIEGLQAATAANPTSQIVKDSSLGKEDFLTLLVAQLQNQDPLNPDEPTEFTAQLAQFSSLEQLFNLNDNVEQMAASVQSTDKMGVLDTIGKNVAYKTSSFDYNGDGAEIGYSLDANATQVKIYLKQGGSTIKTFDAQKLTPGNHFINWDGTLENGNPAPHGTYDIVIQAQAVEGHTVSAIPLIKSEVTGVDLTGENGGTLQTRNGETSYNALMGVYELYTSSENPDSQPETPEESHSEEDNGTFEQITQTLQDPLNEAISDSANGAGI